MSYPSADESVSKARTKKKFMLAYLKIVNQMPVQSPRDMPPHSIPADFPLDTLNSQELKQVCIGIGNVRLCFDKLADMSTTSSQWVEGAIIDIEAGFELREVTGRIQSATNESLTIEAGCLACLLGQTITSCERLEKNELLLSFSNRVTLRLLTDPVGFEPFHLHIDGQSTIATTC